MKNKYITVVSGLEKFGNYNRIYRYKSKRCNKEVQ